MSTATLICGGRFLMICSVRWISHEPDYDAENPAARGADWSLPASAMANAIATIKAVRRGKFGDAQGLLDRGFAWIGVAMTAPVRRLAGQCDWLGHRRRWARTGARPARREGSQSRLAALAGPLTG
jgi:hypothetical protein